MNRAVFICLMCGAAAIAQPKFSAALVGVARDTGQHLRLVHGVAGSFVLHDTVAGGAVNWAFAGGGGLVKTESELLILGSDGAVVRRRPAPEGSAVLSAQGAFFPASAELWLIAAPGDHKVAIEKVAIEPDAVAGRVIALGPTGVHGAQLAVCRASQLWLLSINTANGAVTRELAVGGTIGERACHPAQSESLVMMGDRMILATPHSVVIQTAAGVERHIPISVGRAARLEAHRAGAQWLEVETAGAPPLMIRTSDDSARTYQLPAAKERR